MYNYSIVIPHFGTPDLLDRCLRSIPERPDIQVVVVDDHSPDGDSYFERYPQLGRSGLTFLRASRNGGVGFARNQGLPYAEGTWLLFCDADDTFAPGAFRIMDKYLGSDSDIIYFRPLIELEGEWDTDPGKYFMSDVYEWYDRSGDERLVRSFHVVVWSKMIRRSLVVENDLRFEDITFSEDVLFSIQSGIGARRVTVSDDSVYRYHLRQGSVSHLEKPDITSACNRVRVAMEANKILEDKYSLPYGDVYAGMADLFGIDKISFWKFFRKTSAYDVSKLLVLRSLAARYLGRGVRSKRRLSGTCL